MKEGVATTLLTAQPSVLTDFGILSSPSETVLASIGLRLMASDDTVMMIKKIIPTYRKAFLQP